MSQAAFAFRRSKLLLDDAAQRCVQPVIATALGLSEAFLLQQLHYWLTTNGHWIEGIPWVYNTAEQWHEQLPFLSISTIRRTLRSLEKQVGIIRSARLSPNKSDRTKWYTIDYDALEKRLAAPTAASCDQNGQAKKANRPVPHVTKKATSCRSQNSTQRSPKNASTPAEKRSPFVRLVVANALDAPPANDHERPTERASPADRANQTKQARCAHPPARRGTMVLDGRVVCHQCFAWVPWVPTIARPTQEESPHDAQDNAPDGA
jgi:hypothetical protein